jgi:hypothetical protein
MSDNAVEANSPKQPTASNPEAPLRRSFPRRPINQKPSAAYYPIRPTRPVESGKPRLAPRTTRPEPIQVVKDDLARVAEAWHRYQSTRSRDGVYGFLDTIYEIGRRWNAENHVAEYCRWALKIQPASVPMYAKAYAVLIFCAGQVDDKARSKWSRVLRVAEAQNATSIQAFVKDRGGINKVAAMFWEIAELS